MSDLDSPYYPEILALGGHAIPDASEYEQEVIGRRAFCFRKREERRKEMGFRPEAEQCLTKIPREEALRMLRESRDDLEEKLAMIKVAEMEISQQPTTEGWKGGELRI